MNLIKTEADVAEGAAWLAAREPRFALALLETGPLPLRLREGGFSALLRAIVSQQISVAAGFRARRQAMRWRLRKPGSILQPCARCQAMR